MAGYGWLADCRRRPLPPPSPGSTTYSPESSTSRVVPSTVCTVAPTLGTAVILDTRNIVTEPSPSCADGTSTLSTLLSSSGSAYRYSREASSCRWASPVLITSPVEADTSTPSLSLTSCVSFTMAYTVPHNVATRTNTATPRATKMRRMSRRSPTARCSLRITSTSSSTDSEPSWLVSAARMRWASPGGTPPLRSSRSTSTKLPAFVDGTTQASLLSLLIPSASCSRTRSWSAAGVLCFHSIEQRWCFFFWWATKQIIIRTHNHDYYDYCLKNYVTLLPYLKILRTMLTFRIGSRKNSQLAVATIDATHVVSVVVQWYGYLAFTQKTWVQFPAMEIFFKEKGGNFFLGSGTL